MTTLDIRQLAEQGGVNPIAPVTVPEAVKFENGADLTTAIGSIATIETSPATATHAVGDYIVWNGQLYKVISAIAVGETLTVGSNITATSAGSEISALKAGLTEQSVSVNFINLVKVGRVVTVAGTGSSIQTTAGSWKSISTIPAGYRPKFAILNQPCVGGSVRNAVGVIRIDNTTGDVSIFSNVADTFFFPVFSYISSN